MALTKGVWCILGCGLLCTGLVSCSSVPDVFVKPFDWPFPGQTRKCEPIKNKPVTYVIRKGDTLSEIAQCFRVRERDIARYNGIKNPNAIRIGQKLVIPPRGAKVTSRPPPRSSEPKKKQGGASGATSPPLAKYGPSWIWPTQKGKILRKFSPKGSGKQGISIAGKIGQKVVAAASGRIVYSGEGLVGYGKLIIVQHSKDYLTAYAHNNRLLVKEGDSVKRGQKIAEMGKTAAKTPRLHFELRYKGEPIDPLKYLPR